VNGAGDASVAAGHRRTPRGTTRARCHAIGIAILRNSVAGRNANHRGGVDMNKKASKRVTALKLELKKDTVARLTPDMLKQVAGGMIPETKQSHCVTFCINC
jgi:hypothetical protein